jgi:hypothetical protein
MKQIVLLSVILRKNAEQEKEIENKNHWGIVTSNYRRKHVHTVLSYSHYFQNEILPVWHEELCTGFSGWVVCWSGTQNSFGTQKCSWISREYWFFMYSKTEYQNFFEVTVINCQCSSCVVKMKSISRVLFTSYDSNLGV